jgi:hypothetical protein
MQNGPVSLMVVRQRLRLAIRLLVDVLMTALIGALVFRVGILAFTLDAWPFKVLAAGIALGVGVSLTRVCIHKSRQWRTRLGLLSTH